MTLETDRIARAAAWYACRGLFVHPLRPGTKLPLLEDWPNRASNEAAAVAQWWKRWPLANVGLNTVRSGILLLDVDPRNGGDESLHDLERQHGEFPPTWRAQTANRGTHISVVRPDGDLSAEGLGPGIDLPLNVVMPPSVLEGGGAYVWEVGFSPEDVPIAGCPHWLALLVQGARGSGEGKGPEWWRAVARSGVGEGSRNATVAQLAGHLLRKHVDPYVTLEMILAWNRLRCRPPLADDEVETTVDSIAWREAARRKRT